MLSKAQSWGSSGPSKSSASDIDSGKALTPLSRAVGTERRCERPHEGATAAVKPVIHWTLVTRAVDTDWMAAFCHVLGTVTRSLSCLGIMWQAAMGRHSARVV